LPIDNCSLLHLTGVLLNLLQDNRSKEMRMVGVQWSLEDPIGNADHIIPERLPLYLLVPNIGALE
jgi:hypothetical protein